MRILVLLTALVLTGCAFVEESPGSAYIATTYATLKVIDDDPEKAQRVEEIALEVLRVADDDPEATIDRLIETARGHIRWDRLDNADTLLVNALLIELAERLKERFGEGIIPEDARLTVQTLAGWVIDAASTVDEA